MLIGILYTGALRTIIKTIKYMKDNLLLDDNRHVFACLQNDTSKKNIVWEQWLRNKLGNNLKSIEWYTPNTFEKQEIIKTTVVPENWKNYLVSSGSMIEYHQLQLSYKKLCMMEHTKYDYIIRYRTDTVFAKKIDFHWLNWTGEDVQQRLNNIKNKVSDDKVTEYFMGTLLDDCIIDNKDISIMSISNDIDNCSITSDYIKNGRYILTYRKNLLYIVKRSYFYLIPSIYNLYGTIRYKHNDDYWFNSEGQFQGACYNSGLTIYDYESPFENMSLYDYNENNYVDNGNIINKNIIYFVMRH
jgi:hypothetical protein